MKNILVSLWIALFATQVGATPTPEQPDRAISFYNLEQNLGLKG